MEKTVKTEFKQQGVHFDAVNVEDYDKVIEKLSTENEKTKEFLVGLLNATIVRNKKMFIYLEHAVETFFETAKRTRKSVRNNPRALKLAEVEGIDVDTKLIDMLGAELGFYLYQGDKK